MSRFALDQLFLHGFFATPAALRASGLISEPVAQPLTQLAVPAPAKPQSNPAKRRKVHLRGGRYVHA
jgi:hypothetical protein